MRWGCPYRLFGFDSDMSEVIQFAEEGQHVDEGRRTRTGRGRPRSSSARSPPLPTDHGDITMLQSNWQEKGVGDFNVPYVGISSLTQVASREDRVCVLNIWAANRAT
jgi:hypothetical protein